MLSIIICSLKHDYCQSLIENIEKTIGISHEIIAIENDQNQFSISSAYNKGAGQAQFDNLLFLHEDVIFHTENWGKALIPLLGNEDVGIIGISGAVCKSENPSTWSMIPQEYYRVNAIQHWKDGSTTQFSNLPSEDNSISKVAVIDGVFMAMKKEVWEEFPFDVDNLSGFHFYDLDISLRIGNSKGLFVTDKVLIEHFSEGNISKEWIIQALHQHRRLQKFLPAFIGEFTLQEMREIDHHSLAAYLFLMMRERIFNFYFVRNFLKICLLYPFDKRSMNLLKFGIKQYLRI